VDVPTRRPNRVPPALFNSNQHADILKRPHKMVGWKRMFSQSPRSKPGNDQTSPKDG
jgi:hypothetical protein